LSKTKPARMDTDAIFAAKGEPSPPVGVHAPARTVPLPVAPAAKVEQPAPPPASPANQAAAERAGEDEDERPAKKKRKANPNTIATTIAFPPEIMARIQDRLQEERAHNLRTLVFLGLSKIGIEIEPEYLKPERRRWTR
jgi:hypothetical protein